MSIKRREFLSLSGSAAAAFAIPTLTACSDEAGGDGLPVYTWEGTPGPATMFELGVASGDPTPEAVILWTHVAPSVDGPTPVWVEVATDTAFRRRVVAESHLCDSTTDYTLKLDITGLEAGKTYYYRFYAEGVMSPVGRTKTLPVGGVSAARFGVVSCSNFGYGYFHAYRHLAARADLDAVLHLGDYIYEYQEDFYPFAAQKLRSTAPLTEIVTLADYRTRYAHYRKDPDLQAAHRQHPWFVIWDDHEIANNAWTGGAQGHQMATEGTYADRVAAATQAFFEYIPIRGTAANGIQRTARYGDLADVLFLDTRLVGRSQQVLTQAQDDATRSVLGAAQETWLTQQMMTSTARWKVLAQQICVAHFTYDGTNHTPVFMDQWDGYPAARTRLFDTIEQHGSDATIVLTGDLHGACVFELPRDPWDASYDPQTGAGSLAVEFITTSVTSPYDPVFPTQPQQDDLLSASPHIKFANLLQSGYSVLTVSRDSVQSDFYVLDGLTMAQGAVSHAAGYVVARGTNHATAAAGPAAQGTGAALAP